MITGEANAGSPDSYKCRFPAMINDWRMNFNIGSGNQTDNSFPFGFVQVFSRLNKRPAKTVSLWELCIGSEITLRKLAHAIYRDFQTLVVKNEKLSVQNFCYFSYFLLKT